jgi:hypothetical protein
MAAFNAATSLEPVLEVVSLPCLQAAYADVTPCEALRLM